MKLIIILSGIIGLFLSYKTYNQLLLKSDGTDKIRDISRQIQKGALTFLQKESQYLFMFMSVVFFILWIMLGFNTGICFLFGALCSLSASFIGMKAATISNSRTAHAASENKPLEALLIAFNGGSVMGLAVASIGLLGLGLIITFYSFEHLISPLVGFGVGATSVALFARIGGGIYTKAADVGSDLVGKIEAGIPEDDPRNPGVIADNVGDNVGDVAGMGADIFESYVNSIVSSATIGVTMLPLALKNITNINTTLEDTTPYRLSLLITPLILAFFGFYSFLHVYTNDKKAKKLRAYTGAQKSYYFCYYFISWIFIYIFF